MTPDNQLRTALLFQVPGSDLPLGPPPPSRSTFLQSVVTFCSVAIVSMAVSTAALWWIRRTPSANPSADGFLWLVGQNKTWDEYQEEKKSAGRGRLDEKEYDWTQQLINDAYSN